mmetsp:Transcript_11133/g.40276  ORF Transcript_11133/g.40276 Transcript_11133/m.40276 type:complete len:224 (-) Transcript_11133:1794-2465(-)
MSSANAIALFPPVAFSTPSSNTTRTAACVAIAIAPPRASSSAGGRGSSSTSRASRATKRAASNDPGATASAAFTARNAFRSFPLRAYTSNASACVSRCAPACLSNGSSSFAASSNGVFVRASFSPFGSGSSFFGVGFRFFPSLAAASAAFFSSLSSSRFFASLIFASFSSVFRFSFRYCFRASDVIAASIASSAASSSASGLSCKSTYVSMPPFAASLYAARA